MPIKVKQGELRKIKIIKPKTKKINEFKTNLSKEIVEKLELIFKDI
jgi:hypothetical protein|nr:MAG TPA: hypothetical protein [Caudoviricetes sp.]DAJ70096.1 MAG TPA: hypothetical protein [Caudoviricetes sp.]